MKPRLVPRRLRCAGMISAWSALISGMIIGTSGVKRCAELLEQTGHSSFAYFSSRARISSFFMSTAQKMKSTLEAISSASAVASYMTMSLYLSGIGTVIFQRPSQASA